MSRSNAIVFNQCFPSLKYRLFILYCAISLCFSGCASMGPKQKAGTGTGAAIGGVLGAVIGSQTSNDKKWIAIGAVTGAAVGGLVGNLIGLSLDKRDQRVKEAAAREKLKIDTVLIKLPETGTHEGKTAKQPQIGIPPQNPQSSQPQDVYAVTIAELAQFPVGSAELTPNARRFFESMAKTYKEEKGYLPVLIVGHTDASGSPDFNQRLSEARAQTVAHLFVSSGFPANKVFYQGAGASEPLASNDTPEGRAQNRRVEIASAPSTEGLLAYKSIQVASTKRVHVRQVQRSINAQNENCGQVEAAAPKSTSSTKTRGIDFGGVPQEKDPWPPVANGPITYNPPWHHSIFAAIGVAQAIEQVPEFLNDSLTTAGAIKNMKGDDLLKPSDHLPGYYNQPLYGMANKHFVYLLPVSILKDGTLAKPSKMKIILNFNSKNSQKSAIVLSGNGATYPLEKSVLYRWKAKENGQGILGVDVRLPVYSAKQLKEMDFISGYGKLYYMENGQVYVARIDPIIKVPHVSSIDWGL